MRRLILLCALFAGFALAIGWGASGCSAPETGALGGPCYGNGTCNAGLSCSGDAVCQGDSKEAVGDPDGSTNETVPEPPPGERAAPDQGSLDTPPIGDGKSPADDKFSFFVTSLEAMQKLSGSKDGFGGDLGGLVGADRICQTIAAGVGYGHKTWRAFLSATKGPDGNPVHAIDRIGKGPWYDRNDRLIANNINGLLGERPAGDKQAVADLTNEHGQGQHQFGDNHDTMTGSNPQGKLSSPDLQTTCQDWTSAVGPGTESKVMCGHSWPRSLGGMGGGTRGGENWVSDHTLRGCSPGVNLLQNGPGTGDCVGCSGGYGGIYCFAVAGQTYQETGTPCTADAGCAATERCFMKYCIAKSIGCLKDTECSTGKVCRQTNTGTICTDPPPPCKSNAECERVERCIQGKCQPGGPPLP